MVQCPAAHATPKGVLPLTVAVSTPEWPAESPDRMQPHPLEYAFSEVSSVLGPLTASGAAATAVAFMCESSTDETMSFPVAAATWRGVAPRIYSSRLDLGGEEKVERERERERGD